MAHRKPRPVAHLRARFNLTPREMARVMGITLSELQGLDRWANPPATLLTAMERLLSLHAEVRGGWRGQLARIAAPQAATEDEQQLKLFDSRSFEGA